jgi:large subunit ribosomal protein L5e
LAARRLLLSLGIDKKFEGVVDVTGEEYHVEEEMREDCRPFKAMLDVGLVRTTTGNRVFGAMKGACDGGLHIPHSTKRFPGASNEKGEKGKYDPEVHRARIYGQHVAEYMRHLQSESPDKFKAHFSRFIKENISPDSIEEMYANAHARIRANPEHEKKRKEHAKNVRDGNYICCGNVRYLRPLKMTREQRRARVTQKLQIMAQQMETAE